MDYRQPRNWNAANARREAISRRKDNDRLNENAVTEFAFSPSTFAVGMRWIEPENPDWQPRFLVFNTGYPMYGRSEFISDWQSVGASRRKRAA